MKMMERQILVNMLPCFSSQGSIAKKLNNIDNRHMKCKSISPIDWQTGNESLMDDDNPDKQVIEILLQSQQAFQDKAEEKVRK